MQVRQIAADAVGEYRFKLPEDNIRAGVRYLAHLEDMFSDLPAAARERFILAAYNAGPGHVRDAQTLARRLGYDPARWEGGVREALPLLEEPRYYETLPLGYAQGRSVVRYVELVLHRLRHYQRMTAAATLEGLAAMASEQPLD
jgi:membrane-bound lytic murein transglycosylase F